MKTTKLLFLATIVLLLNLFTTSCIPTVPGGNPTPVPQTDTTVIYTTFSDSASQLIYQNFIWDVNKSVDLDGDGTYDIYLDWYINEGQSVCKIHPLAACNVLYNSRQPSTGYYNLNDTIDNRDSTNFFGFLPVGANSLSTLANTVTNNNKLAGFTLTKADGIHYGWMNVSITATYPITVGGIGISAASYAKFKINSMAYKIAPNTPILAGKY